MGSKAGKNGFRAKRELELKRAKDKADWLRPVLEKEDDWERATGRKKATSKDEIVSERRALTRITKKAIQLMCPECECRVRRDTGKASQRIIVEVLMKVGARRKKEYPRTGQDAARMIRDILRELGIAYETYLPDARPGKDKLESCLSISVDIGS